MHVGEFHVQKGELIALVGPSGSGKSTALDLLSTALCPDMDAKTADDSLFLFSPHDTVYDVLQCWKKGQSAKLALLRRKYIGYILQTGGLLPFLHGYDNIALAYFETSSSHCSQSCDEIIKYLAHTLDIEHLLFKKPAQMSVGERQRFAIARALVHEPRLILADEPVASLDPYNAELVLKLLVDTAREKNISVVMVSHAPQMARAAGFRLVQAIVSRHTEDDDAQAEREPAQKIHAYVAMQNPVDEVGFVFDSLRVSTPENVTPQDDTPQDDTPENDTPENDTPENDTPENDTPENATSENGESATSTSTPKELLP